MNFDLRFYWTLFLRRLPAMAALFLLCAGIGIALAFKLPTTYSTTASLVFRAPQISGLQGGGQVSGAEQFELLEGSLMTRANLIDIADKFKVFGEDPDLTPDQVVDAMRAATSIKRTSGRDRATWMFISFDAGSPRIVYDVVNEYITLIESESERERSGRTDKTLEFFKQEVEELNKDLDEQSKEIVKFKSANAGALPDSLDYRLTRESALQERVSRIESDLAALAKQRKEIIDVYEATGRINGPQQQQRSPEEQRLAQLQSELQSLLAVYSDTHPRVRVLQSQISQLESQIAGQGGAAPEDTTSQEAILNLYLTQIDSQAASLENTRIANMAELEKLRASIDLTATNGIALDALERDYANIQAQYNTALLRRDQAQIDQNAGSSQLTGGVKLNQPASVPTQPSSPNRPAVAAGGIGAGLAAMAALFLLLEMLNRTIRRPVELTTALGVTPLATIPLMETRRHFWMRRAIKLAVLVAVIIAVPLALWAVDTYYKPLDLIYGRLLARIGL